MSEQFDIGCHINLSRNLGHEDCFSLRIKDIGSGIRFADIHITVEEIANLISNRTVEGVCTVRGLDEVGQIREHKRVPVPLVADGLKLTPGVDIKKHADQILAPFEVDGWKGDPGDLTNSHRRTNVEVGIGTTVPGQMVLFQRWVKKEFVDE